MTKLVKIMRQEISEWDTFQFSGNFPPKCQESSVPTILHSFMSILLNGPHVQDQHDQESQASLTLSQLVCFNSKFRGRRSSTENTRHFKDREPATSLYRFEHSYSNKKQGASKPSPQIRHQCEL